MGDGWTEWLSIGSGGGILLAAALVGYLLHWVFWRVLHEFANRTSTVLDDSLIKHCRRPSVFVFPVLVLYAALPLLPDQLEGDWRTFVRRVLVILLTFSLAWVLIRLTSVAEDVIARRYDVDVADNLRARAVRTQFGIIRKITVVVIGVLSLSAVLMSFEEFRRLGTGILASAGLAGLVIGLAAQKTLSNLLAGIQIAMTQPIRIDDVVIVEGEWGRIEEITLTYVVVRIWDLRRLILPISYFLEKPFQNWTRVSADILGSVFLYVDYTAPLEEIRAELERIAHASNDWDGEVCGLQVTGTSPEGLELRALLSSADASRSWNLRCEVREKLIAFIKENHPESLPKVRTDVVKLPEAVTARGPR